MENINISFKSHYETEIINDNNEKYIEKVNIPENNDVHYHKVNFFKGMFNGDVLDCYDWFGDGEYIGLAQIYGIGTLISTLFGLCFAYYGIIWGIIIGLSFPVVIGPLCILIYAFCKYKYKYNISLRELICFKKYHKQNNISIKENQIKAAIIEDLKNL